MPARRAWLVALAGGALLAGSAPSASAAPDQVIDAGTNADQAAQALNDGCADMANCSWQTDVGPDGKALITTVYGPARIVGDVLYNCSTDKGDDAQTAVNVSDERGESTSLSEEVSLEVSLGFLDLEKQSLEFSGFSGQSQSFKTDVSVTSAVSVPYQYKAWTQTKMLSGNVPGSAFITQGIHLIQVKNIDLQFPGYHGPGPGISKSTAEVVYSAVATPMTPDEKVSRCAAVGAPVVSPAQAARAARALAPRKERFKITVCHAKQASARSSRRGRRRCEQRTVEGVQPPRHHKRNVTATLERAGRVHAKDSNRGGGIRLTQKRDITPGRYNLVMRKKPKRMIVRDDHGKRLHRAEQRMITIVPVTVRWSRKK